MLDYLCFRFILCARASVHSLSPVTSLQTVPVRSKELFYLRALLHTRSTFSFQDLRTVRAHYYRTYQGAATALGLYQDVYKAVYTINKAIRAYSRPSQLRFLFAYLLLDLLIFSGGALDTVLTGALCGLPTAPPSC